MAIEKAQKRLAREALVFRIIWMFILFLVWQIAAPLLGFVIIAQLLYRLVYGKPNEELVSFGDSLSQYLQQIGRFAVFASEAKPWPVADWPTAGSEQEGENQ